MGHDLFNSSAAARFPIAIRFATRPCTDDCGMGVRVVVVVVFGLPKIAKIENPSEEQVIVLAF